MTKSMKKRPSIRFSEEQEQLLEVAENFCRDRFPMAAVRKAIAASEDFDPALWNEIAANSATCVGACVFEFTDEFMAISYI